MELTLPAVGSDFGCTSSISEHNVQYKETASDKESDVMPVSNCLLITV